MLYRDNPAQHLEVEATIGASSTRTTLAVCGDPIICRALVLLLRGPGYDVRYVPAASLSVAGTLTGVQVLLLALEREAEPRRVILELLDHATDAGGVHILELSDGFESEPEWRRESAPAERKISWPCSTEQLKRHINNALAGRLVVEETA